MKTRIKITKEVDIKYLKMFISVSDECKYPGVKNDMLELTINIDTGKIINYPLTTPLDLFEKVVDRGCYYLYDDEMNEILSIENNYVPNELIPGSYGDYVELMIDKDGIITNWRRPPNISDFLENGDY